MSNKDNKNAMALGEYRLLKLSFRRSPQNIQKAVLLLLNILILRKYQTRQSHFSPRQLCGTLNLPKFPQMAQSVSAGCLYHQGRGFKSLSEDALKDCYLDSRKSNRAYDGSGVATAKRSYKRVSELPMVEWS